jgi:catechol 2,3-dioxygenase-like lactoylglutathione lyase family enzyme
MDQRISFVTLAVADLDETRRFYIDGLGWEPALDVPGEVLMIKDRGAPRALAVVGERVRGGGRDHPARRGRGPADPRAQRAQSR